MFMHLTDWMCPPLWNLLSCIMFHLRPKHKFQTLAANRTFSTTWLVRVEEEEMRSVCQLALYTTVHCSFKTNPILIGIFHIHTFTLNIEHFCKYLSGAGICHPSLGFNFTSARLLAAQLLLKERKYCMHFCKRLSALAFPYYNVKKINAEWPPASLWIYVIYHFLQLPGCQ